MQQADQGVVKAVEQKLGIGQEGQGGEQGGGPQEAGGGGGEQGGGPQQAGGEQGGPQQANESQQGQEGGKQGEGDQKKDKVDGKVKDPLDKVLGKDKCEKCDKESKADKAKECEHKDKSKKVDKTDGIDKADKAKQKDKAGEAAAAEGATKPKEVAGAANASLRAREWKNDLVFLHEVQPGPADRSYGVQVAKLAGLPPSVVERARVMLETLEQGERDGTGGAKGLVDDLPLFAAIPVAPPAPKAGPSPVAERLAAIHPDELTPREALDLLYELKALTET